MTQRTKAGLQTNLNTDLADNSTGDISAADVRGNLIDFTDSVPFLSTATTHYQDHSQDLFKAMVPI